jgi:thiol:disulfide interchange protein DsbD
VRFVEDRLEAAESAGAVGGPEGEPAPETAELPWSERISGWLRTSFTGASVPLKFVLAYLAGLAIALTPCIYPMIPITAAIVAGQQGEKSGRLNAPVLSLAYVLGIATTLAVMGFAAGLLGSQLSLAFQNPWGVGVVVVVFLVLAGSMFGLYDLKIGTGGARKLSRAGELSVVGVAATYAMGLASGLVAVPCVTAPVAAVLVWVATQRDWLVGAGMFFALGLGFGTPLFLVGTFTGLAQRVPKPGTWMVGVKRVMGWIMVGAAVYFATTMLPEATWAPMWAAYFAALGVWLVVRFRAGAVVSIAYCIAVAVAFGPRIVELWGGARAGRSVEPVEMTPYTEEGFEEAVAEGKPVILDFWATWCLECRYIDGYFNRPAAAAESRRFAIFKVDIDSEEGTALGERYGISQPPAILFFDSTGELEAGLTARGDVTPEGLVARMKKVD